MSFFAYIKTCRDGIDPQGDFVREAREDPDLPDAKTWRELDGTFGRETRGIPQFAQRKRSGSITWLTGEASLIPREAPARRWTAERAIPNPIPGPLRERPS
jgi:hypothetical protein